MKILNLIIKVNFDKKRSSHTLLEEMLDFFYKNHIYNCWEEEFILDLKYKEFPLDNLSKKEMVKLFFKSKDRSLILLGDKKNDNKIVKMGFRLDRGTFIVDFRIYDYLLSPEKIEYLWEKLTYFYWQLGGNGVLYAQVSDMKDLRKYIIQNLTRVPFSTSLSTPWRVLMNEDYYTDTYQKSVYETCPFYVVKTEGKEHLYMQVYKDVFDYMNPKTLERYKAIFLHLSKNENTEEDMLEYDKRITEKAKRATS